MERRLAAILLTDIVGYSRLMEADEEGTLACQKLHREEVFNEQISAHDGRIVKTTGDGLLVEFSSVVNAVKCALDIQIELRDRDVSVPADRRVQYRIGINLGDVVVDGTDILGDGVNIAARLEGLAEPGGVCISGAVHDQLVGKLKATFEEAGEQAVKNISRSVKVLHWRSQSAAPAGTSLSNPLSIPAKPSIAVLPFANLSGDPEQGYFSDGITEDIIIKLSRFRELFVIARDSSFAYQGGALNVGQIGNELGVRHVLFGSVRRAGNRVRITVQMADATTGDHIWAEQYDRDLDDIFAVQDEVTQIIVATLTERIRLAGAERARRKPTSLLAAYEYVLRGRECFHKWNSIDNLNAYEMFSQAAEIDPDYALAYAHMAHAEYANWIAGWSKAPIATFNHFCELAEQALMLDDFESMTHNMIALAHLYRRRHDEARLHAEKALELSPNDADVVMIAGYVAMFDGEQETAIERVNQAARLNPFGRYGIALGMALFSAKRYQEAIVALGTARGKLPHVQAYLAASYAYIGAVGQAQVAVSQLIDVASSEMVKVGAEVPENWSKFLLEKFPYRLQTDLDHLLLGLRKAGVH